MKILPIFFLIATGPFIGCTPHITTLQQDKHETSLALREVLQEVADLRHALNNLQIELQILDEEVKQQESTIKTKITPSQSKNTKGDDKVIHLERRVESLEDRQNKIALHGVKIEEIENSLKEQKKLLLEISQLKSSLNSLANSLYPEDSLTLYKVKAGDSLEKIARLYKISVTSLKEANNLSHNKIIIGQELKIPAAGS